MENIPIFMEKEAQLSLNNILEISQKPYISYIYLIY